MTLSSSAFDPPMNPTPYFMDDPREGQRLADKVDPQAWVSRFVEPLLQPNSVVLDVGCGPGVLAAAVAARCPRGRVVALDQSPDRAHQADLLLAPWDGAAVVGDAAALPFADASFDLVYCRFLLEYLPQPGLAVREMARVLRPGGRLLLQDLDGQLVWHYPQDAELERQVLATLGVLASTGFDPVRVVILHPVTEAGRFKAQRRVTKLVVLASRRNANRFQFQIEFLAVHRKFLHEHRRGN